ncbi:hypothetical protein HS088_TW03G00039 [Tripterygium wilfordii]|uniref:Uncharacterized protein n=1 Tax=Tripterygium wilfordii TaxID=458696 RepID=A0A7J7DU82_TRIWF|nr:hypothetical protein HS088_TW03G00039 [Tripterygium wilfordii]
MNQTVNRHYECYQQKRGGEAYLEQGKDMRTWDHSSLANTKRPMKGKSVKLGILMGDQAANLQCPCGDFIPKEEEVGFISNTEYIYPVPSTCFTLIAITLIPF